MRFLLAEIEERDCFVENKNSTTSKWNNIRKETSPMARRKATTKTDIPVEDTDKINAEITKSPAAEVSVKTKTVKDDFMNPPEVKEATQEETKDTVKETAITEKVPAKEDAKTPAKKPTARKSVKKVSEKPVKAVEKKPATRRTAKKESAAEIYIQYLGKELSTKNILENIKNLWTGEMGRKEKDLKDVKVYIKPEENKAYFVVSGNETGYIWL